jgi:hypothetical protein
LKPWLKTPFCNQVVRDSVKNAIEDQIRLAGQANGTSDAKSIRVMLNSDCQDFVDHAYGYYVSLLALRKMMGPLATAVLTKQLGRTPTQNEFNAEVQSRFGERGALLARKGVAASNSPNKLTDEHLVLSAIMTAILRGTETFVVTRDPDLLEQFFKLLCLIKEHYRAMLIAELYTSNPSVMNFIEVPVENDGVHIPSFTGSTFLRCETTDIDLVGYLPSSFHFVNVYCYLIGGEPSNMKLTSCSFCGETEIARVLRVKASTAGLNTEKLDGRNCVINTSPLTADNHRVIISIGHETTLPLGDATIGISDFINALHCNEESSTQLYDQTQTQ